MSSTGFKMRNTTCQLPFMLIAPSQRQVLATINIFFSHDYFSYTNILILLFLSTSSIDSIDYKLGFSSSCMLSLFSPVWLFMTLWTIANQVPLSVGFPRQDYWSGLPYSPAADLPDQETEPRLISVALAGGFFTTGAPEKPSLQSKILSE